MSRFSFKNLPEDFDEEEEEYEFEDLEELEEFEEMRDENPLTEEETLEVKQLCDCVNDSKLDEAKKILDGMII